MTGGGTERSEHVCETNEQVYVSSSPRGRAQIPRADVKKLTFGLLQGSGAICCVKKEWKGTGELTCRGLLGLDEKACVRV